MSQKKEKKTIQWKALLISFGVSCAMLGVVIGLTLWYTSSLSAKTAIRWEWEPWKLILGNGIAFLIMFAIVYHFVKKPKKKQYEQEKW